MAAKNAKKFAPRASSALTVEEDNGEELKVTPAGNDNENTTPISPEGADNTTPEGNTPEVNTPESVTPEGKNENAEENSTPPVTPEVKDDDEPTTNPEHGITFTADTESKPIERRVKVRLARKFDACIGGEWYHFKKDEVAIVPENVKRILSRTEGMLKPL